MSGSRHRAMQAAGLLIATTLALAPSGQGDEIDALLQSLDAAESPSAGGAVMDLPPVPSDYPGETTRVVDPYTENDSNPLFLTSLPGKPWWDDQADGRAPILITEPVGLERFHQPVSFIGDFPEGTVPESLRVVTPYGRELPSQVRVVDPASRIYEIVFELERLDASAQVPLFVYYGRQPLRRPRPAPPDPCLRVEERENGIALVNSRLQAEFNRTASQDQHALWREIKRLGAEFNMISRFPTSPYEGSTCGVSNGTPARVLEDGPVRKTLSYGPWGDGYTVSLYAHSRLLSVIAKSGMAFWGFYLPGGDTLHDTLCYECPEGLKRMPIDYCGGNTPPRNYDQLASWFSQGWFALLDNVRPGGLGWFYDRPGGRPWIQTVAYGYWVTLRAQGHAALYVAEDARTESCRDAYIAWKCPPRVRRGNHQPRVKIEPRVPRLGEDFIRMHFLLERLYPRIDTNTARACVEAAIAGGANYLFFQPPTDACLAPSVGTDGKPGPALFDELARECHARGMGLAGYTGYNLARMRDMIRRGLDCVFLADEWCWHPGVDYYPLNAEARRQYLAGTGGWGHTNFSAAERADFRNRYGADMPNDARAKGTDELDELLAAESTEGFLKAPRLAPTLLTELACTNLNDPSQLAMFRMKIDANNLFMGDAARTARQANSNILVTTVTSPRNLGIPGEDSAFADFETLAESFSTVCLDLYSNDGGWLNGMIKYARGAQGNRRPLFIISGYAGWDDRAMVELNQHLQVMYGANGLCYFAFDRLCSPWPLLGATDAFTFFDYTGLGDFAARAWPLEFVGVLRDRDEFFASLARGETCNTIGTGSLYEQSIYQMTEGLAMGFAIPVNVIAATHLEAELRAPYKLIVVPNNPTLSDANAALLRGFMEAGGHLIVEGETIRNAAMAALAGVRPAGKARTGDLKLTGITAPLEDWSATLNGACQPVELQPGTAVLATLADSQPAITLAAVGKGKAVYIAPRIGPHAKSESLHTGLRRIAQQLIGYVPVTIEPNVAWTTVLTDGERYCIGAFNCSGRRRDGLSMTLRGFPPALNTLTSLRTGETYPVTQGKAGGFSLLPGQPDYFMLAPSANRPATRLPTAAPIGESRKPGMDFLDLPPFPKQEYSVPASKSAPRLPTFD